MRIFVQIRREVNKRKKKRNLGGGGGGGGGGGSPLSVGQTVPI